MLPVLLQGGEAIQKIVDKQKLLGNALSNDDMEKVQRAAAAWPKLEQAISGFKNKMLVAFAPLIELVGNKLTKAVEYLVPIFNWVARAASTHWHVVTSVVGEVFEAIGDVIEVVGNWITEIFGVGQATMSIEDVVLSVWKAIAMGAGYVWDILKVGAGSIAYVASFLVEGFSKVVDVLNDIVSVAKDMPDAIKPSWVDGMVAGVDRANTAIKKTGADMRAWGKGTFDNFGKSAEQAGKWVDKLKEKGKHEKEAALADTEPDEAKGPAKYVNNAAMTKGSEAAYSTMTKFAFDGLMNPKEDLPKQALNEAKKANGHLKKIADKAPHVEKMKVIK